ncbi:MAG TPA: hypothetical protein VEI07_11995 [Planctomycetaceae bacterium]|nr:hypothetical protein [Planctomycetaceae bacterium]
MLNSKLRQLLDSFSTTRASSARRRKAWGPLAALDRPAEVLEQRTLLTAVALPYLVFSTQPSNIVAGHDLYFRAEVMINVKTNQGTVTEVDTAFNGTCSFTPIGPGTFDTPYDFTGTQGPNAPFSSVTLPVVDGFVGDHHKATSIDTAGNYEIQAVATSSTPGVSVLPVNSSTFTVTPFSATDRLVFIKAPSEAAVDAPISATVAVEDQFGNIDTSVNNVPVTLLAIPGNGSTSEIKNGEATFNDAVFVAAGPDTLLAVASPPTGGSLAATDVVEVFGSNGGAS